MMQRRQRIKKRLSRQLTLPWKCPSNSSPRFGILLRSAEPADGVSGIFLFAILGDSP